MKENYVDRIGLRQNYQTRRRSPCRHARLRHVPTYLYARVVSAAQANNHGRRSREQWRSCGRSSRCPRARTSPSRTCPSGSSAVGATRRRGQPSPSATSRSTSPPRPAVAIGDFKLDIAAVADAGLFQGPVLAASQCFHQVPALTCF
jgi:hypothetical protein